MMATTMGAGGTVANDDVRCPTGGGEAPGVPYANKRRVLKRSVRGNARAHPALCRSATPPLAKRPRLGQPCSSRSEVTDYIELLSDGATLKHDVRSDSEDGADSSVRVKKRLRTMPPGHADWRPIQLPRLRRSHAVVEVGQTANQTLGNPHGGKAGRSDLLSRFAFC